MKYISGLKHLFLFVLSVAVIRTFYIWVTCFNDSLFLFFPIQLDSTFAKLIVTGLIYFLNLVVLVLGGFIVYNLYKYWIEIYERYSEIEKFNLFKNLALVMLVFFGALFTSNFLVNRYTGLSISVEGEGMRGETSTLEYHKYVISNKEGEVISDISEKIKVQDNLDGELKSKKFFFEQAANFEGYKSAKEQNTGFIHYLVSVVLYLIEQLLRLTIFIFVPLLPLLFYYLNKAVEIE